MPTVAENVRKWEGEYHWNGGGENWSTPWGDSDMQWHASILPRIHSFVPTGTILEIAPGYGRWTHFLKDLCDRLIAVDISDRCIQACQERFADQSHMEYHVNDGQSLDMIEDHSVDFAFSFDSLVHVEAEVLESYLQQLSRKLTANGVAFLHHSNMGEHVRYFRVVRGVPGLRLLLRQLGLETRLHGRAASVSAVSFEEQARKNGLQCISQEVINWQSNLLTDCISICTPAGSKWTADNLRLRNSHFMQEADHIAQLSRLYSTRRSAA